MEIQQFHLTPTTVETSFIYIFEVLVSLQIKVSQEDVLFKSDHNDQGLIK